MAVENQALRDEIEDILFECIDCEGGGIGRAAEKIMSIPQISALSAASVRSDNQSGEIPNLDEARRLVFDWEQGCAKNEMPDWLLFRLARLWGVGPAERREGDA